MPVILDTYIIFYSHILLCCYENDFLLNLVRRQVSKTRDGYPSGATDLTSLVEVHVYNWSCQFSKLLICILDCDLSIDWYDGLSIICVWTPIYRVICTIMKILNIRFCIEIHCYFYMIDSCKALNEDPKNCLLLFTCCVLYDL